MSGRLETLQLSRLRLSVDMNGNSKLSDSREISRSGGVMESGPTRAPDHNGTTKSNLGGHRLNGKGVKGISFKDLYDPPEVMSETATPLTSESDKMAFVNGFGMEVLLCTISCFGGYSFG